MSGEGKKKESGVDIYGESRKYFDLPQKKNN